MAVAFTTITDPSGTAWPLNGSIGLWEANGRQGFDGATYQHYRDESPAVAGAFWRGVRATTRELIIPIFVMDPSGANDRATVRALRRALVAAIAPWRGECVITMAYEDGSTRSINARYVDGMEGSRGPGEYGITKIKYSLRFVADKPYMYGPAVSSVWALATSSRTELPIPGADTYYEVVTSPLLTGSGVVTPLNTNTGFESGTTGWSVSGGTLAVDTSVFVGGAQSAMLTPDGVSSQAYMVSSSLIPITGGRTFLAQGWLRSAVTRAVGINVNWYDGSSTLLSTSTGSKTIAATSWVYFSEVFIAPANAAYAAVAPILTGTPPASNVLWADDVIFGEAAGSTMFNPGDVEAWPTWVLTGPFTSVTAQNTTNGQAWSLSYTAASTDQLILTTEPGEVQLVDGNGNNRWDTLTGNQLWPLENGNNLLNVQVNGATTASSAVLTFVPRYEAD
jgi:hypothetical protein